MARLRDAIPDLSLTTDLIVGLPRRDRRRLRRDAVAWSEECAYDGAYTFLYSPRPGTEAGERLADDVPPEVEARAHRGAWWTWCRPRRRPARPGSWAATREVLVEGPSRTDPSRLRGRLRQNITVNFAGDGRPGDAGHGHGRVARPRRPSRRPPGGGARAVLAPPEVLGLFGPTAAGKSALAHAAARELGGEIVVADPFQRYRGLEIAADSPRAAAAGRGAPPLRGRPRPRAGPRPPAGFARAAHAAIDGPRGPRAGARRGAGGTGLYVRAALADSGFPDDARRRSCACGPRGWWRTTRPRPSAALARPRPRRRRARRRRNPRRVWRAPSRWPSRRRGPARRGGCGRPETRRPTLMVGRHPAPRGARPP